MAQGSGFRSPVHFYNSKNNPYFMIFFQKGADIRTNVRYNIGVGDKTLTERQEEEMIEEMTDKQADKIDVLSRIDELDQLVNHTTDPELLKYIEQRKKELRETLTRL